MYDTYLSSMALIFELCTAIPRWKRIVPWDEEYGLRDQETSKNAMIVETESLLDRSTVDLQKVSL